MSADTQPDRGGAAVGDRDMITLQSASPTSTLKVLGAAAVVGQQPGHVSAREPQPVGETVYRGRRTAA